MARNRHKEFVQNLLSLANIKINGSRPWDIKVHDERLYKRVMAQGSLGLGEAYMDGWWDCKRLDQFFSRVLAAGLDKKVKLTPNLVLHMLKARTINLQDRAGAKVVGRKHYDVGNALYGLMLDKRMNYSCGYWKNARTLDSAQEAKLDLICRKLGLKPGMSVLDIGCGWGGFAAFAAKKYGVKVLGVTISKEQAKLAGKLCRGLPVRIRLQDYRDVREKFDRIVSIGMFEHVGYKNYRKYMKVAAGCLKDGGLFLLHTIGSEISVHSPDPWIEKYIFPNSMIPSARQVSRAAEGIFVMEDWHNFGAYYDRTLMAWHANFEKGWHRISKDYGERFRRMWNYYLLSCAGSFRSRKNQLWQIVFSKSGVPGGYVSIR